MLVPTTEFPGHSLETHAGHAPGATRPRFFEAIPPERVGLYGEYDHSGLAKRVAHTFRQTFPPPAWVQLNVAQRGGVVVLTGAVPQADWLTQMTVIAASVSGTIAVEILGVRVQGQG